MCLAADPFHGVALCSQFRGQGVIIRDQENGKVPLKTDLRNRHQLPFGGLRGVKVLHCGAERSGDAGEVV